MCDVRARLTPDRSRSSQACSMYIVLLRLLEKSSRTALLGNAYLTFSAHLKTSAILKGSVSRNSNLRALKSLLVDKWLRGSSAPKCSTHREEVQ